MTCDFAKIEEHLLHMHAGLLSLHAEIPEKDPDHLALFIKAMLRVNADQIEKLALSAARGHALLKVEKRSPEVARTQHPQCKPKSLEGWRG